MNARIVAAAVLVALAAALGYFYGTKHAAPSPTPADGRKVLYWHDPMYPGQRFDRPGKSPYMDMELVPVYADSAPGSGNGVRIDPSLQQNLGIRTAEVVRGTLAPMVEAVGSVAYNERDVAVVQARSNGFVEKLHVRAPLDPVRKGQPLADLYVPEWVAAQEEYLSAKRIASQTQVSGLGSLVEGAKQRMRLAGMSDEQVEAIERGGKVQPRTTLAAPIGGVVSELAVREGMTVMAGAPLFRINGLGTVWVNAELPEAMASHVRPGAAVEAHTTAFPGTAFKGRVSAILPEVSAATRTIKARVEIANPEGKLVPGMFASVRFAPQAARDVLLVPSEAVIATGKRTVVMVAQGNGRFAPVDVETGGESEGRTEIRKGLEAGQKVVVSGQFLVDSEASFRSTENRMASSPAAAAPATHHANGVVERVGDGEITLSHGPVPSMQWPSMTMAFAVPASLHVHAAPGDKVSFDFRQTPQGTFEIVKIEAAK